MTIKRNIILALILTLALVITGCSGSDDLTGDDGELALSIADAPVNDAQHVWVTLDQVEVHSQEEGWKVMNDFEGADYDNGELKIDLLALRFDEELLGQKNLPEGTYDQIRLIVAAKDEDTTPDNLGKSYAVYEDEQGTIQEENIFIPSGTQTGLKIDHQFTIESDTITRLVLDNDVSAILKNAGQSGKIILRPTAIDIIDKVISGDVEGIAKADTDGDGSNEAIKEYDVVVEAKDADGNVVKSTVATTEETTEDKTRPAGSFKLRGLKEGTYTIDAYAEDSNGVKQYELTETKEVEVTADGVNTTLVDQPLILSTINTQ
ncbi:MAG: DUF4382 domain-containing protein [Bacillota bacterium]